jgi:hypothetical protein
MNRPHEIDFDWRQPDADEERSGVAARGGGGGPDPQDDADRRPYQIDRQRGRVYDLRDDEMRAMRTVGAFRAIDQSELKERSLSKPLRMGLVSKNTMYVRADSPPVTVVALTRAGRRLVEAHSPQASGQRYYSRVCKVRELRHDLSVYGAFRNEARDIHERGGKVQRVVLDYEFKSAIAARLNGPKGPDQHARRLELADELQLPVVDGHLRLPDVRIEYEDENGRPQHLDLEITTEHYRGQHGSATKRSGFKMSAAGSNGRTPVKDDHHLKLFG